MSVKIKERDHGFKALLKELAGGEVTIGVQGAEALKPHGDSGLTVGNIAVIHELGLGVPQRSWLRAWMDANHDFIEKTSAEAWGAITNRTLSRKVALERMGQQWVSHLQDWMLSGGVEPPLAESTIARKGNDIPLIDTMELVTAITAKVKLQQLKSIKDPAVRAVVRANKRK